MLTSDIILRDFNMVAEVYEITKGFLPEGLKEKLFCVNERNLDGNILEGIVDGAIVPDLVNVLELDPASFYSFYYFINNIPDFMDYVVMPPAFHINTLFSGERGANELERMTGSRLDRSVVFSEGVLQYPVLLHELLHDVFWSLPQDRRDYLSEVVQASCKREILVDYSRLNSFGVNLADEFIAAWYTRKNWDYDRFDDRVMPEPLRAAMKEVGYKVSDAPPLFASPLEELFLTMMEFSTDLD